MKLSNREPNSISGVPGHDPFFRHSRGPKAGGYLAHKHIPFQPARKAFSNPDGGYYHKDGVYWRPDMKTHFVYDEECWHLANGGILTGTGVYYPPITAPDGFLGFPWRLAAVTVALIAGPPQDPGTPPEKPPVRVITEVRSSSDR